MSITNHGKSFVKKILGGSISPSNHAKNIASSTVTSYSVQGKFGTKTVEEAIRTVEEAMPKYSKKNNMHQPPSGPTRLLSSYPFILKQLSEAQESAVSLWVLRFRSRNETSVLDFFHLVIEASPHIA